MARVRIEAGADGSVVVELPRSLRRFVRGAVEAVRRAVADPAAPGHLRVMGRVDADEEHDDPFVTLERQSALDGVLATVAATEGHDRLSQAEAEAWLEVFSLALAVEADRLKIAGDDDMERLGAKELDHLRLLQTLQAMLVVALVGE